MAKRPANSGDPDPADRVVVLHGKEALLREEKTANLRKALEAEHGGIEVIRFSGESTPPADVLDECRSFGLMSGYKLVIADEADKLVMGDNRPLFERYATSPPEGATLLLRSETWRPGNLDKAIVKVGRVIKCEPLKEPEAHRWAIDRAASAHDSRIDPKAAGLLIERLGTDLTRIDQELSKLATGAGPGGSITREAVVELVGGSREEAAWSVQSELLTGSPERAIRQIRAVLDGSRSDMAVPTMWACVDLARKLHSAAVGIAAGENQRSIAGRLRLWGDSTRMVLGAAEKLGPAGTARLLERCVEFDAAGKSGRGNPSRNLERLAIEFAGAVGS